MKTFYNLLLNTLVANVTNSFLWFALTFWAYLGTQSVIVTAVIGGSFMLISSFASLMFGNFVDHHKKKTSMLVSSTTTLIAYALAGLVFFSVPAGELLHLDNPVFWVFVLLILLGAVVGNMRMITLSTLVTLLVDEKNRDKANGMVGTVNGVAFAITSVFSGLVIGLLGMSWAVGIAVVLTFLSLAHLLTVHIQEKEVKPSKEQKKSLDLRGTFKTIAGIPGLFGMILFTTFNNLLGGVFMALMDAYGLSLVSVQTWGTLWGVLSCGFIVGGLVISKKGLGKNPLRTLLLANVAMWTISILFPARASIVLLASGMFAYMCLIPIVEAVEQTLIQKLVVPNKQGRVFGFAHSIEMAASPISAFIIGPVAQLFFIPFMESETGVRIFSPLLGTGPSRGIALVFMTAGLIGLMVTLSMMVSRTYRLLSTAYAKR